MIKDTQTFKKFEDSLIKQDILPHARALQLFESLWKEAVALRILSSKDPLEGIDVAIRIARILNSCSKKSSRE